ncbi:hypothetical protein [Kordiimonas marina]|uniref:hypothetical protein n=1 Tax=Kordiimonas marina TaxID=2872312 RepID=UPI001FF65970|nr:hypothetical protein [Kordiimonas marina]MCJ9429750.1 hypothetical protein [Kordiimonas marina]
MRPKRLRLEGVTRQDRHQVIAAIGHAVTGAEGWVVDHTLFSNMAAAFQLALPAKQLPALAARMKDAGVRLDTESLARLADFTGGGATGDAEIFLSLSLTFLHNEPDLRREIPAVPG